MHHLSACPSHNAPVASPCPILLCWLSTTFNPLDEANTPQTVRAHILFVGHVFPTPTTVLCLCFAVLLGFAIDNSFISTMSTSFSGRGNLFFVLHFGLQRLSTHMSLLLAPQWTTSNTHMPLVYMTIHSPTQFLAFFLCLW